MSTVSINYFKTNIGELILGSYEKELCLLDFRYRKMRDTVDRRIQRALCADFIETTCDILGDAKLQIDEYLFRKRTQFDLPLKLIGTEFQLLVWRQLQEVPYGETITYKQLASRLDRASSVRAVAAANGANALALIVPCHRVIGSHGELVGYGGGTSVKERLLAMEQPDLFSFNEIH